MDNQNNSIESINFEALQKACDFNIAPYEGAINIENSSQYKKIELNAAQKTHLSALLQQVPSAVMTGKLTQMYTITFPEGLPHTLMQLKNGGFATPIIGADGKIAGMASLYPAMAEAAIFGVFTAMSVVTGQFFLFQINKELKKINQRLDKIIEFLYGDKKAELVSEINFTKYVYENYISIMTHKEQRIATISGLQQARKVAIKDIEFYMFDLENTINSIKSDRDIVPNLEKCYQTKDCLDLSVHLYMTSGLLEMYYAQNHDRNYIKYIEKSEKRMLGSFSKLHLLISNAKEYYLKDKDGKQINKSDIEKQSREVVEALEDVGNSSIRKFLHFALNAATEKTEYYLSRNGDVYSKALSDL